MSSVDRPHVLITRPSPGAEETAALVAAMGFAPVVAPMLAIHALPIAPLPAHIDAIVLTSRNGLLGLPPELHSTPLFAVGAATAAAARAQGFGEVRSADGDATALRGLVRRELPGSPALLLPTARGQGGKLAANLRADGCVVHRRAVYEARPVRALPDAACAALTGDSLRAALFFSAETARAFVAAVRRANLDTETRAADACAIGGPAGVALEALPWRRVRVAARPTQDELLALLQ